MNTANNPRVNPLDHQTTSTRVIYTVSDINQEVRTFLEDSFAPVWIIGEISNFVCPNSGHWYFSLKDAKAQIRCAMFQGFNRLLKFKPQNGLQVLVRGKLSLYEARGDFQLIVDFIEAAGDGALRQAFEMLKMRLAAEGLFEEKYKKPLPQFPQTMGVITSATGAAIRDILSVLQRRFRGINIIIYPTMVQGTQAAIQIVRALQIANRRKECDVLIVGRGGGSLEDLWPFNEEAVARAIFASKIPVVSAVGHEIDFTIADFVADYRAATPSAAAELLSPDGDELARFVKKLDERLSRCMQDVVTQNRLAWFSIRKRLRHPMQRLQDQAQRLDIIELNLRRAQNNLLQGKTTRLNELSAILQRHNPLIKMQLLHIKQQNWSQRLSQAWTHRLAYWQQQVVTSARNLEAVSPQATLARGYAIVTTKKMARLIRDVQQVQVGESVTVQLRHGQLDCEVKGKK